MWKRKNKAEVLPWYRKRSYKGKMSEAEKRILDSFRMQERHPAATTDQLPEEVQSYIHHLAFDLHELKQDKIGGQALAASLAGAALLYISYFGLPAPTVWSYIFGAVLLVGPWLVARYEWKKNDEEYIPATPDPKALDATNEGIRSEWELDFIVGQRRED